MVRKGQTAIQTCKAIWPRFLKAKSW